MLRDIYGGHETKLPSQLLREQPICQKCDFFSALCGVMGNVSFMVKVAAGEIALQSDQFELHLRFNIRLHLF